MIARYFHLPARWIFNSCIACAVKLLGGSAPILPEINPCCAGLLPLFSDTSFNAAAVSVHSNVYMSVNLTFTGDLPGRSG